MRGALAVSLTLLAWAPAQAGELVFANGHRLAGELSNEALMVSTGAGLVEVTPEEVLTLSRDQVRLRDGREIRGTLVGGQVKVRTALGEIAVKVDELQVYRGSEPGAATAQGAASRPTAPTDAPARVAAPTVMPVAASGPGRDTGISGGLPTMAAYQDPSSSRPGNGSAPGAQTAALTREPQATPSGRTFEIIDGGTLYRDALYSSSRVGQVLTGQQVKYVDSIDRRLRILNLLVFDGGHWVKVRLPDGTEGWLPADSVREVR